MSDKEKSMWEASTGLPLEGARVHTTAAVFTYDQEYNADAVVLKITFQPVDDDGEESGEVITQNYSVGKAWQPAREGAAVEHKSGKVMQFNDMTVIWKLLTGYMTARGEGDKDAGKRILIEEGADPTQAETYIGWDVTMGSIKYKDMNDKDRSTFAPSEWHGWIGAEEAPAKPAKATKALAPRPGKAAPAAPAAEAESEGGEAAWRAHFGPKLYITLKKLAKEANDHDGFMEAAFGLDDVTTDDKKWNKVAESYIMDFGDDSLFAAARG